jgi:hypothetical protein
VRPRSAPTSGRVSLASMLPVVVLVSVCFSLSKLLEPLPVGPFEFFGEWPASNAAQK